MKHVPDSAVNDHRLGKRGKDGVFFLSLPILLQLHVAPVKVPRAGTGTWGEPTGGIIFPELGRIPSIHVVRRHTRRKCLGCFPHVWEHFILYLLACLSIHGSGRAKRQAVT